MEFVAFPKIPRLFRECVITEKIDGTNASVHISEDGVTIQAASRNKFITPQDDNYGFARWVEKNKDELLKLGPGRHYGEWWGVGINRGYELSERRFSLFHTHKIKELPGCCGVVPILGECEFHSASVLQALVDLANYGSYAAKGYTKPEGIVIYHKAAGIMFKATLEGDKKG